MYRKRRRYVKRRKAYSRVRKARRRMSVVRKKSGISRKYRRGRIRRIKFTSALTPPKRLVKLRFFQTILPSGNVYGAAPFDPTVFTFYYRCNNINGPSGNTAPALSPNHSAMLYDQFGQLYRRNIVLGSKLNVKICITNQNAGGGDTQYPPMIIMLHRDKAGGLPAFSTTDHARELARINPDFKVIEFHPTASRNSFYFNHTWSIRKTAQVKDPMDNLDDFSAAYNNTINSPLAAPAQQWIYTIVVRALYPWNEGDAPNIRATCEVSLNYITVFYDREENIPPS